MAIQFSKLILPVRDLPLAIKFLTFIFDCEVNVKDDHIETQLAGQTLVLKQSDHSETIPLNWQLAVDSYQTLEFLAQKIELFCYREGRMSLIEKLNSDQLTFWDTDGHHWVIEIFKQKQSGIVNSDVRNF